MNIAKRARKSFLIPGLASCLIFASGCGGKDGDDSPDETPENGTVAGNAATAAASEIKAGSASEMLLTSTTAMQSAQVGSLALSATLRLQEGDGNHTQSANDKLCSNHGDPWDETENAVRQDGDGYIGHKFYCKLNSGAIESVDTIPGFITQQGSIICSIEEAFEVTVEDYTEAGKELVTGGSTNITLSDTCWPQGQPDGMTVVPMESVILTKLADTTGWQYEIKLASSAADLDASVRFFNAEGIFGFKFSEAGRDPGAGSDLSVTIDTSNGVLLFNEVVDSNRENDTFRSLSRLRVKGTLDENLQFSSIDEGSGYMYVSGPGFDASANQDHTYSVYTVDGDDTAGFQFKQFWTSETPGTLEERVKDCSDGDGTCSTAEDIASIAEMEAYFKGPETARTGWKTYAESGKPMCEPDDAEKVITIDAQPVSSGNLGKCASE